MTQQHTEVNNEQIVSYTSQQLRDMYARGENLTDWAKVDSICNEDIDDSDLPEDFWENARLMTPKSKTQISFRVDKELLA